MRERDTHDRIDRPTPERRRRREADRAWDRFTEACARWYMARLIEGEARELFR